jgi:hypothetical protein
MRSTSRGCNAQSSISENFESLINSIFFYFTHALDTQTVPIAAEILTPSPSTTSALSSPAASQSMVTIESTQLPCHANSHMNALPKNRTSRPWGTHKGCPNVTRFLLRQRASSHQPGRLNIKNHDDHHHGGHYWPYPPNYWEIDTPPAAATQPVPEHKIRPTASATSPSVFVQFLLPSHHAEQKYFN